ncbi:hypothetical protein BC829DRAFT_381042 [Chytridium lagenaria]|nr:hypothetical protein BC829DRAFT_381042 [Chytridium lagenaria]
MSAVDSADISLTSTSSIDVSSTSTSSPAPTATSVNPAAGTLSALGIDLTKVLVPGNCYSSNLSVGIPVTKYGYTCAPHFYCPNTTISNVKSLPQICPPSVDCQLIRLATKSCEPQGQFEPQVCAKGYYCPIYTKRIICPEGNYCPAGSIEPRKCPSMSLCKEGSVVPKFYGGLVCVESLPEAKISPSKVAPFPVDEHLPVKSRPMDPIPFDRKIMIQDDDAVVVNIPSEKSDAQGSGDPVLTSRYEQHLSQLPTFDTSRSTARHGRRQSIQPSSPLGITDTTFIPGNFSVQEEEEEGTEDDTEVVEELRTVCRQASRKKALDRSHKRYEGGDCGEAKGNGWDSSREGVTGTIRSRRLTAIMGPSGAGKTTFMNVLMARLPVRGGKLYINGQEAEMNKYKKIIGYVPQDDIMLRELTVRENIKHSASIRLPSDWSGKTVEEFVDSVMDVLNLSHMKLPVGVSGGQRKRVNIGMELAAVPLALFLDEPTSGLDSTAALKVAEILKRIASIGLTVVAVIHQPRFEIFQQFDDILMIAPGGKTAYLGPTNCVLEYFESHGFFFDPRANPADILMDILSDKGVNLRQHLSPEDLVNEWETKGSHWVKNKYESEGLNCAVPSQSEGNNSWQESPSGPRNEDIEGVIKKRGASWIFQAVLCHNRYMIQQYRLIGALVLEICVASLAGGLMGIAVADGAGELFIGVPVQPYTLLSSSTLQWLIPQLGLLIGISCGLAGAPAGVKVFGEEKPVYWREAAAGHNKLAYFVGKTLASSYRFVLTALHFAAIFCFLATPITPFPLIFSNFFLQFYCVYGLAAVVSMIVRRENASLLAVVTCLFAAVFCGYGPTVRAARRWGIEFIWHLSYNRWATEAFFSEEISVFRDVYDIQSAADYYGYVLNSVHYNLFFMFIIGVGLRVCAFLFMVLMNRDKQK